MQACFQAVPEQRASRAEAEALCEPAQHDFRVVLRAALEQGDSLRACSLRVLPVLDGLARVVQLQALPARFDSVQADSALAWQLLLPQDASPERGEFPYLQQWAWAPQTPLACLGSPRQTVRDWLRHSSLALPALASAEHEERDKLLLQPVSDVR